MNDNKLSLKRLAAILIIVLLGAAIWWAILSLSRVGETKVTITSAPSSATLKLDGKAIGQGDIYVSEGAHEVEAELEGFETAKETIEVNPDGTKKITLLLKPNSQAGMEYLIDNPDYQLERENIGSQEFEATSDKLEEKYPYIDQLPVYNRHFKISYGRAVKTKQQGDEPAIALYIDAIRPQDKVAALESLYTDLGVEANSVEVIFERFDYPFGLKDDTSE